MGIVQTNLCDLCHNAKDNIKHALWDCEHIQSFWKEFQEHIHTHCHNAARVQLNKLIVILGTDCNFRSDHVFDFIMMFAKFYIYQCRHYKTKPNLLAFRKKLKQRYRIEQYNNRLLIKSTEFSIDWAPYHSLIDI